MPPDEPSSIRTSPSLLGRLKAGDDSRVWDEFFHLYSGLIHGFAIREGLSPDDADDIVQQTMAGIVNHLPGFEYNPKKCKFKTWVLNLAKWRINDLFRKRRKDWAILDSAKHSDEDKSRTDAINRLPDPASLDVEKRLKTEWQLRLYDLALEEVKKKFHPKQYQVFDMFVKAGVPAAEVARNLGVNIANVYVIKHRFFAALTKEIKHLEKTFGEEVAVHARLTR